MIAFCISVVSYDIGYHKGTDVVNYHEGYSDGYYKAVDTIQYIIDKQKRSDSTVSKVLFIDKDTITYYIQKKNQHP